MHATRRAAVAAAAGMLGLAAARVRAASRLPALATPPICRWPTAVPVVAAADGTVTIDNFAFTPAALRIPAGTVVNWTNRDDIPHTVTAVGGPPGFRSQPLDTDDRFAFRFDTQGTYRYFCALHPHMQGTVVVT